MTPLVSLHDPDGVVLALRQLRAGQAIAFPTDTVYGVGACALDGQAVEQLYRIKERPRTLAIPLLLSDRADVAQVVTQIPPQAEALARRFWPGALTLVLPARDHLPAALLADGSSVAVRVPDHAWLRSLIRELGQPLAATSANLHGRPDCTSALAVADQIGDRLSLIVDGGDAPGGVPSTVVDSTGPSLRVLRRGGVVLDIEA